MKKYLALCFYVRTYKRYMRISFKILVIIYTFKIPCSIIGNIDSSTKIKYIYPEIYFRKLANLFTLLK